MLDNPSSHIPKNNNAYFKKTTFSSGNAQGKPQYYAFIDLGTYHHSLHRIKNAC